MTKTIPKSTGEKVRADAWDRSHGTYLSGRAAIDGADALAVECERRWGAGRLRLLVSPELREKFDRQRYKYQAAISAGTLQDVIRESERMANAWRALDQAAAAEGHQGMPHEVLEAVLNDGTVLAVVPSVEHAAGVPREGRQVVIATMSEVALLFELHRPVVDAKRVFPGATVTATRQSIGDPLDAIAEPTGLDTPFNDPVPAW